MKSSRQPLAGVTVVELATDVSGPFIGKLLGDFGADVIKIEPPDGDRSRRHGPFPGKTIDPEQSALFLHLNTNKRSAVADLNTVVGQELVRALTAGADVLLESFPPGQLAAWNLGYDSLSHDHPGLVMTSVTPFGQTGPYRDHVGADIVTYAMGGPMWGTGISDREPLKLGGEETSYQCGQVATVATMAALMMARVGGGSTHIDLSCFEAQAGTIDRRVSYLLYQLWGGGDCGREARQTQHNTPVGFFPTLDGHALAFTIPSWIPRMLEVLDDDDLRARFADPRWMYDAELPDLVDAAFYPWILERTSAEAASEGQAHRWPITPLNAPVDIVDDPHFVERDFFVEVEHPVAGRIRQPGPPFRLEGGWAIRHPAPTLGQHQAELEALATDNSYSHTAEPPMSSPSRSKPHLPLEGVRVLDLTVVWAGPACTMYLADLGAEVIRVDNPYVFPTATRGGIARPPKELVPDLGPLGGYPDLDPGERPWNRHTMFCAHARNKLSCTLDLASELGRETFLDLVETADVLVENNSVGVLPKLGLDWATLQARNPRLIELRMPPMGLVGPYANWIGFGANFEALCGLTVLRGYRYDDPTSLTSVFHMDPASGAGGAFAVMCALWRREQSGQGEQVEFPQSENMLQHIGEYLIDATRTGRRHTPGGNRSIYAAPQGCYPCLGDDEWVVISVPDDDTWSTLVEAMGSPLWARDTRFSTSDGRQGHHDELDAHIETWTRTQSSGDVHAKCQALGVPAGPVLRESQLRDDPQMEARDWFRDQGSIDLGRHQFPGQQWRWTGPELRWGPINRLGDSNRYIYREILGYDDRRWQALVDGGHITEVYYGSDGEAL